MKEIISISLGPSSNDYEFEIEFLGHDFRIRRFGTDRDEEKAAKLLSHWEYEADAIGLGMVREHYSIGTRRFIQKDTARLESLATRVPVTTGSHVRAILQKWAVRHTQLELKNNFNNARVLFLSGMLNYEMATVMSEFTENLTFADPVLQLGIPKVLTSLKSLELYSRGSHELLKWTPSKVIFPSLPTGKKWNKLILRKAMQKASIIVGPFAQLENYTLEELGGKTVITSTLSEDRIQFFKECGVKLAIDVSPQTMKHVIGMNVLEAMIMVALGKSIEDITSEDYLEIIRDYNMEPRLIYPSGAYNRVNRFAFVIHPLSQEYFKKIKPVRILSEVTPNHFMTVVEKVIAHSPPFVYSTVSGIKSPTGDEAEGWLISVGGTPREMLARSPEFTYRRLLAAAKMAERMGASIMGLGAFTKVVGDAGVTVSKRSTLPITSGNSYSASGALWAAADAARRMGIIAMTSGKKIKGKAMVIGATGSIGAVSARLLAKACEIVYLIAPRPDKLLELKKSIEKETPDACLVVSTEGDEFLADMDMIVTTTSGAGKKVLDITKVKPGCIITDVARPLDLPPSEVAKRPDVLVIESGEILIPGTLKMKNIGLPENVVFACMAETIVLALEGRYEVFTIGREIEWEKVKEIYALGLKHGMRLAAISGVNGVYSDEDILRVRDLALKERKRLGIPTPGIDQDTSEESSAKTDGASEPAVAKATGATKKVPAANPKAPITPDKTTTQ
ncbi:dehydrogenase [Deltaproteobacteria bacterium TL4]